MAQHQRIGLRAQAGEGAPVAPAVRVTCTGVFGVVVALSAAPTGSGFTVTVTVAGVEVPPGPVAV